MNEFDSTIEPDPIEIVVDGVLDLHTFNPKEIKRLVPDYLYACQQGGIYQARIIHGKGRGTLRRTVHAILERLPIVRDFALAPETAGSWGATLVSLHPGNHNVEK